MSISPQPVNNADHPTSTTSSPPASDITPAATPAPPSLARDNPLAELSPDVMFLGRPERIATLKSHQLLLIGKENLQYLKQFWVNILTKSQPILERQAELIALLEGKTVADLLAVAHQYDNPQYKSQPSRYSGEKIAPDDPEALKRAPGSTTLNICGWCKFALARGYPHVCYKLSDGSTRHYDPTCGVLSDEWTVKHRCEYNTPCRLTHPRPNQPSLTEICAAVCERHKQHLSYRQKAQQQIDYLDALIGLAESKPIFPAYRTPHHYPVGTPVYFLYDDFNAAKLPYPFDYYLHQFRGNLHRGTITSYNEYQFVKSSINITDAYAGPDTKKPLVFTYDYDGSCFLSVEEMMYLCEHPDYAQIWLNSIQHGGGLLKRALAFHQKHRFLPGHTIV